MTETDTRRERAKFWQGVACGNAMIGGFVLMYLATDCHKVVRSEPFEITVLNIAAVWAVNACCFGLSIMRRSTRHGR